MNNQAKYLARNLVIKGLLKLAEAPPISYSATDAVNALFGVGQPAPNPSLADGIYDRVIGSMQAAEKGITDLEAGRSKINFLDLKNQSKITRDQYKLLGDTAAEVGEESKLAARLLRNYHLTDFPSNAVHSFIRDKIPGPSWAAYAAGGGLAAAGTTALIIHAMNKVKEKKEAERQEQMMLEAAGQV